MPGLSNKELLLSRSSPGYARDTQLIRSPVKPGRFSNDKRQLPREAQEGTLPPLGVNKIEAAPSGQLSYATPRFEIIPKLHTPSEVEDFDVHPFLSKELDLPTNERGSKRFI